MRWLRRLFAGKPIDPPCVCGHPKSMHSFSIPNLCYCRAGMDETDRDATCLCWHYKEMI